MHDEDYKFVRYWPWKGALYGSPESMFGPKMKILIVGESHYWYEGCIDDPGLTRRVFDSRAVIGERRLFDENIAAAFIGDIPDDRQLSEFWQSVAFYNYVRHLIPASSDGPTREMFGEPEAYEALKEVLTKLTPNLVVMFAKKAYNYLPQFDRPDPDATKYIELEAGYFTTSGAGEALLLGVDHPSAWPRKRQSFRDWHPFIRRAMEYCAHQT